MIPPHLPMRTPLDLSSLANFRQSHVWFWPDGLWEDGGKSSSMENRAASVNYEDDCSLSAKVS